MKFFHLSDLHIGLKLYNRDFYEDQIHILNEIIDAAAIEQPDAIVIAGDIYDKSVPSSESVEVFDSFLSKLSRTVSETEIMIISGNHDSASRINMYRDILRHNKLHMIGTPPQAPDEYIEKVTLNDVYGKVNFYLLPFIRPSTVKAVINSDENINILSYDEAIHKLIEREAIDVNERNVIVSHQFYIPDKADPGSIERMESEIITVGNIDSVRAGILEMFDYAALGHIHKPMKVGSEAVRYCGTPIACSISEACQKKGIVRVELEDKGTVKTSVIPLTPLHNIRVIKGTLEEVAKQCSNDYASVLLTDKSDLDILEMQDKLRYAFPNLLEIRRETQWKADYMSNSLNSQMESLPDVYELCNMFLKDMDIDEQELLRDVVNTLQEEKS